MGVLKKHPAGASASDLCRKHMFSGATFDTLRSEDGGTEVSEARKLKRLGDENSRLKKPPVELMLDVRRGKRRWPKTSDA